MCEKCYLLPSAGFLTPNRLEVAKPGLTEAPQTARSDEKSDKIRTSAVTAYWGYFFFPFFPIF